MALALMGSVYCKLPQQRSWYRIRFVSLMSFGKELPLDLSGAQRHVTHDQLCAGVADNTHTGDARCVIMPGVPLEPCVERLPPAVKVAAVIVFQQWARSRYFRHVGGLRASSLIPATSRPGLAAQASNRAQSLAGMMTIRRSSTSISAASSALRRTKSLTLVRACDDAASRSARS
jgi:hypothetical protein